jgi:hypothetical protein
MKLKRFLLRYDPPGVGLEVQEDGSDDLTVVHKDLPAGSTVSTREAINALVENLIKEEPSLLTSRRHRPALVQLLGRLYNVEVEPSDDDADDRRGGGRSEEVVAAEEPAEGGVQEGQTVVLIGFKGKLQVHNGELATVTKAKADKQKYEVQISASRSNEGGETLKVKSIEHMVPVAKAGTLVVGCHVAIRGLRNHIELNGCLGRVVECHEESHRFEVRATDSGQLFRVKQENLIPIEASGIHLAASKENREPNTASPRLKAGGGAVDAASSLQGGDHGDPFDGVFEAGSTVQLVGLKTAMCYNGQTAEVLSVDHARCRYEIRLNDGSVKTIRAENVRLVSSGPSKTSPRTRRPKEGASKPNK